eukprot:647697-Pelagomonas_calceolata.AAC.3
MRACVAECAPCKQLLPFIAYCRLSLDNQQQTAQQRLLHPHTRAGGASPAPRRISKLPCLHLSIHAATRTTIRTKVQLTVKFPERATSRPRTQQGHPLEYADEACVDWSCSEGLRWLGWESQNQYFVESLLPNFARCTPGHQNLAAPVTTFSEYPNETFCLACTSSVRAGGALGGPCWASPAQLPNKIVSEHFRQGPIHPPDTTGLAEVICLVCMPGFRAGGALGGPRQLSVNFTRKQANLGAYAP